MTPNTPEGQQQLARLEEQNRSILRAQNETNAELRRLNERMLDDHDRITRLEVCTEGHDDRLDGHDTALKNVKQDVKAVGETRKLESRILALVAGLGGLGTLIAAIMNSGASAP